MEFPLEFRTYDGTANHARDWGMADLEYLRKSKPAYADGANAPSGPSRPNARAISNAIAAQSESRPAMNAASDYMWVWGQFLDHDLDDTAPSIDPPKLSTSAFPQATHRSIRLAQEPRLFHLIAVTTTSSKACGSR